ncbi:MAG: TonB-dependent receptor plug domain-containing protein [Bacteroides sp.]|nr:TonB-dependent receptor plug domain-containing protein [Bacteroides sp.]
MTRRTLLTLAATVSLQLSMLAENVTISARDREASVVFAEIMRQTDKNFIYDPELLKNLRVSVVAKNEPLEKVLERMLAPLGVGYRIKGRNILLSRRALPKQTPQYTVSGFVREQGSGEALIGALVTDTLTRHFAQTNSKGFYTLTIPAGKAVLRTVYPGFEPVVTDLGNVRSKTRADIELELLHTLQGIEVTETRNHLLAMGSSRIGATNLSASTIAATPTLLGESDIIKVLQLEPGVSAGTEGLAGMYVHGGNGDENMYMLDNVPLYQVNHLGGLFSAFNTEAIKNADFYKSSFPARYDGRLSSYLDVHTKDGSLSEHHGSFTLGLISGTLNIDGPLKRGRTSYSLAVRRSWLDVLSIPTLAIAGHYMKDSKPKFGYALTDVNAKINHHFSDRSRAYAMFYWGNDYLRAGTEEVESYDTEFNGLYLGNFNWGNLVASGGWNYVFSPKLYGELTATFTHYSSVLKYKEHEQWYEKDKLTDYMFEETKDHNAITDWIGRGDFEWSVSNIQKITFGCSYIHHTFMPLRSSHRINMSESDLYTERPGVNYAANEFNLYAGDDISLFDKLRVEAGAHFSLYHIEGKTFTHLSPRISARLSIVPGMAVKAAYDNTVQYVHQLVQGTISLPSDQWVPVTANWKPQTADKVSAGIYWSAGYRWTLSAEGYWKWMRNILEYKDDFYLSMITDGWDTNITSGSGRARGIDFKAVFDAGPITTQASYSLLWADRKFAEKNSGQRYPAMFDNRHKINLMFNWHINDRWDLNATWTGMSGNRITLSTMNWEDPGLGPWHFDMTMPESLNNYRLPFYHRLDLGAVRRTQRGHWTFSLYNAYCNMNVIGVVRSTSDEGEFVEVRPGVITSSYKNVFKYLRLLPIIPSISYTWIF